MEIKQIINGIKVYTPIARSRLYEHKIILERELRKRIVRSEKVRRISSYIDGKTISK